MSLFIIIGLIIVCLMILCWVYRDQIEGFCTNPFQGVTIGGDKFKFIPSYPSYGVDPNIHNVADSRYNIVRDMAPKLRKEDVLNYADFDISDWEIKSDIVAQKKEIGLANERTGPSISLARTKVRDGLNAETEDFGQLV